MDIYSDSATARQRERRDPDTYLTDSSTRAGGGVSSIRIPQGWQGGVLPLNEADLGLEWP